MELIVSGTDAGERLDHFLQQRLPEYSRSRLQQWIKAGQVLVNGRVEKASYNVREAESIQVTPIAPPPLRAEPEDIPLDILYEDENIIAVNKPAGLVVHAGAGRHSGTLVNALLHHYNVLSHVGGDLRPGIVHRIDRYTSGVLLIARNDAAHRQLAAQFSKREVEKVYLTLVEGRLKHDHGRINSPISRDPVRRTRMTARLTTGRAALSEYRVLRRFAKFTYCEVRIGTGRTHQIRVHMASIGHPVAGDKLYGASATEHGRYFLHAARIGFTPPGHSERITISAPLAPELDQWLTQLPSGLPQTSL